MKVTKCSKTQADEIAQEIEDWIELTTTTQEIWDQLVIILKTKNIRIRGALRSKLGEEVEDMLDRIELSDVEAIPHEEFLELLKAKNTKKSMFCSANPAPKSPSKPIRREREDVIAQCRSLDFGERSGNLLRQNTVRISDV